VLDQGMARLHELLGPGFGGDSQANGNGPPPGPPNGGPPEDVAGPTLADEAARVCGLEESGDTR
jgi:hypothetical protein